MASTSAHEAMKARHLCCKGLHISSCYLLKLNPITKAGMVSAQRFLSVLFRCLKLVLCPVPFRMCQAVQMLCTMLTWAKSGLATSPPSPPSLLILAKEVLQGLVMKMADLPLKRGKQTVERLGRTKSRSNQMTHSNRHHLDGVANPPTCNLQLCQIPTGMPETM